MISDADGLQVRDLVGRDLQLDRQLLIGGLAAEFLGELHRRAPHLGNLVHEMDGQADRLGLVGEGALDGLLDPPRGVGGELAALARVEALDRLDQADVALADQIQQRQAEVLVVHRDLHHQAQVGRDHMIPGRLVAAADALGQLDLLLNGQEGGLADFLQVKLEVAAFAVRDRGLGGNGFGTLKKGRRRIGQFNPEGGRSPRRLGRY